MDRMPLLPICAIWLVSVAIVPAQGGLDDGLVSYFKLDDGSGTTAVDSSGNGHHGTLVGTQTQWVEGYFDGGVLFATGEAEAHVEFPTTGMSVTAGTISVWGYLGDPQASRTRYFFGHTTRPPYGSRIQIYMDGGTTNLDLGLGDSHARRTDMMVLPTETWTHVVLTWDKGTYVVYVNGASIATGAYTGLTALDPVANISDDSNPSESEAFDGILDEARIYNRAITAAEVMEIFRILPPSRINAQSPKPEDKAVDVPRDTLLTWTASEFAAGHDVYFGTVLADAEAADRDNPMGTLAIEGQPTTAYQPPDPLVYSRTYYWRIDEVNAAPDNTIFKGEVWSFTVEPYSYPLANVVATASSATPGMGSEKTVDGSGLNAEGQHSTEPTEMWLSAKDAPKPAWIQFEFDRAYKLDGMHVWNYNQALESFLGFGIKDVTIEYSLDCATWTALGDFVLPQAPGDPTYTGDLVDLGGIIAKCVRLVIHSNWGGIAEQYGLSEVQFLHVPTRAWDLKNEGMGTEVVLTWRAGREADYHRIYVGTDRQAVADGTAWMLTAEDNSLDLGTLQLGTTYYCRVDEVNEAAVPSVWEGDVWSFTTSEFLVVDDLEGYTDDEGNRIYESWIDGMTNELSGSQVGYDGAPFAERSIVHGGKQSMPLLYDNDGTFREGTEFERTGVPYFSEAELEISPAQNWTTAGADTLSLWVRGYPAAYIEDAGVVTMTAGGHDIWDAADDFRFAHKTLTGNGSALVKVESLVNTNVWAKAGVMIRQSLDADSKFVYMIVSPGSGVSMGYRTLAAGTCLSVTQAGITAPQWVKLTRTGDAFTAQYSADGKTWTDLKNADGTVATTTVTMTNPVYVGLCVTSHDSALTTTAVMSGAQATGTVTGDWQVATIGDDKQPANAPAVMYVTVVDSASKSATVTDPAIVTSPDWTQWKIPLDGLTGVNVQKVGKLILGVDNRDMATKGAGLIFIDDIGFGRPLE